MRRLYRGSRRVVIRSSRSRTAEPVTMAPKPVDDAFVVDRGFAFRPVTRTRIASSFGKQVKLGWNETVRSLGLVYRFLRKIGDGQVPLTALGGPVTIAKVAYEVSNDGYSQLLLFLGFLSVNLAVLNFLPIPVLDGGHMVFLCWEGITRKRPNEQVLAAATYVGMIFVLGLMIFVLYLDIFL